MPNKNYIKGRALEYEIVKAYKKIGGKAARTAGSHGWIDIVAEFTDNDEMTWDETLPQFDFFSSNSADNSLILKRLTKKYEDTLFVWIRTDRNQVVHLIQAKRKAVKRGSQSTT